TSTRLERFERVGKRTRERIWASVLASVKQTPRFAGPSEGARSACLAVCVPYVRAKHWVAMLGPASEQSLSAKAPTNACKRRALHVAARQPACAGHRRLRLKRTGTRPRRQRYLRSRDDRRTAPSGCPQAR